MENINYMAGIEDTVNRIIWLAKIELQKNSMINTINGDPVSLNRMFALRDFITLIENTYNSMVKVKDYF